VTVNAIRRKMWALKVTYEDGSEELIGPFVYKTDALMYSLDRIDPEYKSELVQLHMPAGAGT
jgi:hypothetical protein